MAKVPKYVANKTKLEPEKAGRRKNRRSRTGLVARRSQSTKAVMASAAPPKRVSIHQLEYPESSPWITANDTEERATMPRMIPNQSIRLALRSEVSGTKAAAMPNASKPKAKLNQKIKRQL